jgi:DNA polymerase I
MLGSREKLCLVAKTPKQLHWIFQQLQAAPEFAFDIETTHATKNDVEYHIPRTKAKVLGVSFSWAENRAAYIPVYKNGMGEPFFRDPITHQIVVSNLKKILEKKGVKKIAHNGKFDCMYLWLCLGIFVEDFEFDTMIAHWVINENGERENWAGVRYGVGHALDKVALEYLGQDAACASEYDLLRREVEARDPKYHRYETVPVDIVGTYACADAIDTYKIYKIEDQILHERNQLDFFLNHEMAKTFILTMAEIEGIPIKPERIQEMNAVYEQQLRELRSELAGLTGFDFDPAHPGNTEFVLFEHLKLDPIGDKGKSGHYSTKKFVLERLAKPHIDHLSANPDAPCTCDTSTLIPGKIIEYRNISRMKTNYSEAVHKYIDYDTKRFHMSYKQHGTDTGRLSAPIIQSMPSDKKGGKVIKSMFWAGQGNVLLFNDFSQIELRVMAELSGDETMIAAFKAGEDIHTATAKRMLGVTDEWIKDPKNKAEFTEKRRQAKTINFGILFGEGAKKLGESLGLTLDEAKALVAHYFKTYPGVEKCVTSIHKEAEKTGIIRNPFGRIRHLDDIKELIRFEMPKYIQLSLNVNERAANFGDSKMLGGKAPLCFKGEREDVGVFPPSLTGHLKYDLGPHVKRGRPPSPEDIKTRLAGSPYRHVFSKCQTCPYIAPCAWDSERNRRRAKLQRNRRQAFSSYIQGTAVDMCMNSMVRIQGRIQKEKIPAHGTRNGLAVQILQVHDEIGVLVAKSHADVMSKIIQEEMERWPNESWPVFSTPIKADPSPPVESWGDQKK